MAAVFLVGLVGLTIVCGAPTLGQKARAQAKAAARAVIMQPLAQQVAGEDAMVRQVEQQYGPQFKQMLQTELHFMRVVCQPTKHQFEKIAADAEVGKKEAIKTFAQSMRGVARGHDEPRTPITAAIAKSIKETLSAHQFAKYQKEVEARLAARKHLFVTNLVSAIDRRVILTPDQRDKLAKVLTDNYDDSWQMQVLMYDGQYFPPLPEAKIRPILTDAQRKVWDGATRSTVHFGVNLGFVRGQEIEEEVFDEDPPKKKAEEKKAEEKKAPRRPADKSGLPR